MTAMRTIADEAVESRQTSLSAQSRLLAPRYLTSLINVKKMMNPATLRHPLCFSDRLSFRTPGSSIGRNGAV
jgi:hypothetical protein